MSLTPRSEVGENKVWEGEDSLPSLTFVSPGNWRRVGAGELAGGPGGPNPPTQAHGSVQIKPYKNLMLRSILWHPGN